MIGNSNSDDERFEQAEAMEERGQHFDALKTWRELVRDHPDAEIFCRQARLAEQLGYIDEAERAYGSAIQADAKHPWAKAGLASILLKRGESDEAARLLQQSLTDEKSPITHTMLGVALMSLGRDDEAVDSLEAAISLDPGYEEAYFNLAQLRKKADRAEAERLLLKALEADPEYVDAHRELGWLLSESQEDPSPSSEYHIRRSIELKPDDAWARIYLGNVLWKRADVSGSIREFERAIQLMPQRSLPLWSLANLYEAKESWNEAEALYERAIQAEPDDAIAHMNFGRMLKKKGDTAKARDQLRLAVELDPNYAAASKLLSEIDR